MDYLVKHQPLEEKSFAYLETKFENLFTKHASETPNIREILPGHSIETDANLKNIITFLQKTLETEARLTDLQLAKIWFVQSKAVDTDPKKLPYLPHFDKARYLKAMVYLHETTIDHGPISLGQPIDPNGIEIRRKSLPENYKELGLNIIDKNEIVDGLNPILGAPGDIVFFDTNTPHAAGIVKSDLCRKVVRFDFTHPTFNVVEAGGIWSTLRKLFN